MSITFWLPIFLSAPAHPDVCATRGTPLLEMRDLSEVDKQSTTTKIFASGAWTIDTNGRRTDSGCFDRKELRAIRRAVQRAPWKVTSSPIACFAYDPDFTEYRIHGRLRFTERMCSGKTADNVTLRAIDLVKQELADESAPPVRTPLFEIRHRSDAAEPTSTIAIYANGAWTYQPIDKDGRLGALSTGYFDKRTSKALHHAVLDAPWDTTFSRIVCKAYSPSYTEYYVHGQREYTARLCGAERLDEKSAGAIKLVESELDNVIPKP